MILSCNFQTSWNILAGNFLHMNFLPNLWTFNVLNNQSSVDPIFFNFDSNLCLKPSRKRWIHFTSIGESIIDSNILTQRCYQISHAFFQLYNIPSIRSNTEKNVGIWFWCCARVRYAKKYHKSGSILYHKNVDKQTTESTKSLDKFCNVINTLIRQSEQTVRIPNRYKPESSETFQIFCYQKILKIT